MLKLVPTGRIWNRWDRESKNYHNEFKLLANSLPNTQYVIYNILCVKSVNYIPLQVLYKINHPAASRRGMVEG